METIGTWPFLTLNFTKGGVPDDAGRIALLDTLDGPLAAITDLLVISHGWNNNTDDATELYRALVGNMARLASNGQRNHDTLQGRSLAILGIYWPSMKWTEEDLVPVANAGDMTAGLSESDLDTGLVEEKLARLGDAIGATADQISATNGALIRLGNDPDAPADFLRALRAMLEPPADPDDDNSEQLFKDGAELLDLLIDPVSVSPPDSDGGITSVGAANTGVAEEQRATASLAGQFRGLKASAWRLLNYTTYYVMKERAGKVGQGLNAVLARVRERRPELRIHLVGHSFGARVVTAAAAGSQPFRPSSLSLLQGAFSHNGFAATVDGGPPGFFRQVIAQDRVEGPIIVTHTKNDRAVGIAYAIASRLSGDIRAAFGDANDLYGGIGRNGAVRTEPGETLSTPLRNEAFVYDSFPRRRITNLLSDEFIADHGAVTGLPVANAILSAMRI